MNFDAIRALDEVALRALLSGHDPVERLWAVWALGLRQEGALIAGHVAGEPSPGVRRHMCVVLAGGELDLLVAMARHDPADEVRATAAELIARMAAGGRLPWSIALDRLRDPAPRVRIGLLRGLPAGAKPDVEAAIHRAIDDADLEVRVEAIDALRRVSPSRARKGVVSRLATAGEVEAALLLSGWAEAVGGAGVHAALREVPVDIRLVAIRRVSRTWDDVAGLAGDPELAIRRAVRDRFQTRREEIPMEAFVHWIEDGPVSSWESAAEAILRHLDRGRAPVVVQQQEIIRRCRRRLAVVEAALRDVGFDLEADDEWPGESPLIRERAALKSLIAWFE